MSKSILIVVCFLFFILGILINSFFVFDVFYFFIILLIFFVGLIIFYSNKKIRLIALLGIFLFLGLWRAGIAEPVINERHVAFYNSKLTDSGYSWNSSQAQDKLLFQGQVISEPDIRRSNRKLTVGNISGTLLKNPRGRFSKLNGRVLVNAPNYPEINYGDWVQVKCVLETPSVIKDFNYGKFLGVKNIYSVCYRPEKIEIIEGNLSLMQELRKQILAVKYKFKKIIDQTIPYPAGELMSAMILGLKRGIPENIVNNFSRAGLSHIIAISGLHVGIITMLLMNIFLGLRIKRRYAFLLATLSLILFLLMVGFRASSIRAGIMGWLVMLSMQMGRLKNSVRALLLAAFILLMINPKLLLGDIGFQLSFLAVLGIIYLGENIESWLKKIKVPSSFQIRSSLMMTLSAQVFVLPLIIYYFGNLSFVAPMANVLVLPFLPFIMIIGFGLGFGGLIFLPLARAIGLVAQVLIDWVLLVADKLSHLPGGSFNLGKVDFVWIVLVYMILGWGIWLKFFLGKKFYDK